MNSSKFHFGRGFISNFFYFLLVVLIAGCRNEEVGVENPQTLAYAGESFGIFSHDRSGDLRRDLYLIDHSKGDLAPFTQISPRHYTAQPPQSLGFHPGVIKKWPNDNEILICAAEGDGSIKAFKRGLPLKEITTIPEEAPRYLSAFTWPGWGHSLAVSPYKNGILILLKEYDPVAGKVGERVVVRLSESPYSIRAAERVSVADINGDGVAELLLAISATGEILVVWGPKQQDFIPSQADVLYSDPGFGMPNEVHPFDLDDDGDVDLIVPDEVKPGKIHLLKNDGQGHFSETQALDFPSGEGAMELRIAKDRDGKVYLFGAGYGHLAIYRKPHQDDPFISPWLSQALPWRPNYSLDMLLEDLDGDGWLDAAVTKYSGDHNVWILHGPLWDQFSKLNEQGYEVP